MGFLGGDSKRNIIIRRILGLVGIIVAVIAAIFVFLWGAKYFAPLICAFIFSTIMEPMVRLMTNTDKSGRKRSKGGLPRSVAVIISMLIVFTIIGTVMLLLINALIAEVSNLASSLPTLLPEIYETVQSWAAWVRENIELLPPEIIDTLLSTVSSLGSKVGDFAAGIAGTTVSWAASFPSIILFVLFTVMSTYFWASGRYRYQAYFYDSLPRTWVEQIDHMYKSMIGTLIGYIKAQIIIMCFMFVLLAVGFAILQVDYVILLALVIAILDALPSIGTGLVLLPWGVYNLLFGTFPLGVGLVVLYLCAIGLRQLLEPRVLSYQIGLHPLFTMSAMYAGLKALGVFGMLVGPVTVIIIKYILEAFMRGRSLREYLNVD